MSHTNPKPSNNLQPIDGSYKHHPDAERISQELMKDQSNNLSLEEILQGMARFYLLQQPEKYTENNYTLAQAARQIRTLVLSALPAKKPDIYPNDMSAEWAINDGFNQAIEATKKNIKEKL